MSTDLPLRQHAPVPALREHVQRFWQLRGACADHEEQVVVPDGCMGLVPSFGAPVEQVVDGRAVSRSSGLRRRDPAPVP